MWMTSPIGPSLHKPPIAPTREWTALFYLDGNASDIERDVFHGFLSLEEVADRPEIAMVAELGRIPEPPRSGASDEPVPPNDYRERWESVRRYEVAKGAPSSWPRRVSTSVVQHDGKIDSRLVADHGPQDMSNPARLEDFLVWGIRNYPSEHYMVVLSNHGGGFLGILSDDRSRKTMTVAEVDRVMERVQEQTGVKPDLLVMDACLMAQAEVAGQVGQGATWYVASQEYNFDSYPMQRTLERASKNWDQGKPVSPEDMGDFLVSECSQLGNTFPTASLLDLRRMPECTGAVKKLADALLATPTDRQVIRKLIAKTPGFAEGNQKVKPYSDYRDLGAFARLLATSPKVQDAGLKEAAEEVLGVLEGGMVRSNAYTSRRDGELSGMSIYLPLTGFDYSARGLHFPNHTDPRTYEETYRALEFVQQTGWDRVVEHFAEKA
jgi:hypothetical protein